MTDELPPARPAATVVVVREPEAGTGLEVLLLKRSEVGAFPGMWVFPGGRVDDTDEGDDEVARARSAAVREALEEVALVVDPVALITWSHWTPPAIQPRRYVTWFFLAKWLAGEVEVDGHEIVEHRWMRPQDALAEQLPMAPPTFVTLHDLVALETWDALSAGPPRGVERYVTKPAQGGDGHRVILWHDDAGYETGDPDTPGPRHRAWLDGSRLTRYLREP